MLLAMLRTHRCRRLFPGYSNWTVDITIACHITHGFYYKKSIVENCVCRPMYRTDSYTFRQKKDVWPYTMKNYPFASIIENITPVVYLADYLKVNIQISRRQGFTNKQPINSKVLNN